MDAQRIADLFGLDGKVALVTGGSRGIGAMIARGLLDAGARVYITARNAEACEAMAEQLSAHGTCIALPSDLADPDSLLALVAELTEREPLLHVLVNNAGAAWGAPIDEYPLNGFDKVLSLNIRSVFHLTQQLLGPLRAAATPEDPARVITVGSVEGVSVPGQENYAYSASKAGVHMLVRHLAKRLASEHITVNAIAPGPFDSKMMAFALDDPETRAAIAADIPLGRIGEPDDMAGAAVYLSSRAGSFLTGAILPVGGGAGSITM